MTRRDLKEFLGMVGYYRRLCREAALKKGPPDRLCWSEDIFNAYNYLSNALQFYVDLGPLQFYQCFMKVITSHWIL